ncbi:SDR family NAD(P)-dependent oxidoreductase [Microbacterium oleivorans]|uniref:SDR family oxidoreductase n=1 Tax=Microbacterium oleivorans TaxID=273677 RepID=A0A4R5YL18_9MICO|nr:SDR family oxidoreductase [Microbacterium oleivorans]TDL45271.1 SDR family oxidoreductase [Microbacterium oleivorans]
MQVQGKVFVVTGGGNGMGRQVTLELLRRGAHVAAVDLNEAGLTETRTLASQTSGLLTTHIANVTEKDAVTALKDSVLEQHAHVDAVVNIAGVIHAFAPFEALPVDVTERVMNVNFWGTVNMCREFLPLLKARPTAALVNMSSLSALIPFATQTFYGASKGAVKQFSEGLYAEAIDTTLAVSTIFPGNISTNLTGNSGVAMIDSKGKKVRSTTPEDAGQAIVDGIVKGSFRILVGSDAKLLDRLVRLAPRWATGMVAKQMASVQ